MPLPGLNLSSLPAVRTARNASELHQFFSHDRGKFVRIAGEWVQRIARQKRDEIIAAGNPNLYATEIDGTIGKSRNLRKGFTSGSIEAATSSVRVVWLGDQLATMANKAKPQLQKIIEGRFPGGTGRLARDWTWYLQEPGKPSRRVGDTVPPTIGINDVLWLVPEAPQPAAYAWFANYRAKRPYGRVVRRRKNDPTAGPPSRRSRGFLAHTTYNLRGLRLPGMLVQGYFVRRYLTGPASRTQKGVPAIRIAFRRSLSRPVQP